MKQLLLSLTIVLAIMEIHGQASEVDALIFPAPDNKIVLVKEAGYDSLLVGEYLSDAAGDKLLAKRILQELAHPYFQTIIKLNQCTRNFIDDTDGPNVLFLSTTEGGFRRLGLIIKEGEKETVYPRLNYVDLVINENNISSELTIYPHELGHVMMANVLGDLPRGESVLQHVSMGITDYKIAFSEGWGEHFQILTMEHIPLYHASFIEGNHYSNIASLWHSNLDEELRLNGTLQNRYIFRKLIPDNLDLDTLTPEERVLLHHTSPIFNFYKLKNAQQMLSCEGMLSALLYQINVDTVLQGRYADRGFYDQFLLSPIPPEKTPREIFTPYENVMLKNFFAWSMIKDKINLENGLPIFIEFINEWCKAFPEDRERMVELFLRSTIGKTVTDETGDIYEEAAYRGMLGDIQNFLKLREKYNNTMDGLLQDVLSGGRSISENIGKEIWVENQDLTVRTTLWSDRYKKNLRVNLNTASEYEIATFGNTGLSKAREIVRIRDRIGGFRSLEEAFQYGFRLEE